MGDDILVAMLRGDLIWDDDGGQVEGAQIRGLRGMLPFRVSSETRLALEHKELIILKEPLRWGLTDKGRRSALRKA